MADYVKALKHLGSYCKFTDEMRNEGIKERLRDRFIAGIRNDRVLRPLLMEKLTELSFDTAVRTAIEQASKDIESLQRGVTARPPIPDVGHTTV